MCKINCRNLGRIEGVEGPLCLEAFGIKTQDHSAWWCWYYKHMSWYWCLPSMYPPPSATLICAWYEFLQDVQQAFVFLLINTHSSCLFTRTSENHSSKFSFVRGWGGEIRGGERAGDRQRLPEVMKRLNSISLWKIFSTRQITSLKKVFIIVWQRGRAP